MKDKNILVIDDKGDVIKLMLDLFKNDSHIKIKSIKSNIEDLKKNITILDYMIIINEDDLDCDLNDIINESLSVSGSLLTKIAYFYYF